MSTRTIVTSHPDVACDVCERRLLRGEQADIFLAGGRRRTVCELCAPRAAHEGWLRERDSQSVTLPPMRPRRGRSLLDRLRQAGRPPAADADESSLAAPAGHDGADYEFLEGYGRPVAAAGRRQAPDGWLPEHADADGAAVARELSYEEQALDVFNTSEFPRRVAGVARSLGAPEVNVRSAEHLASVVVVVVAWELCWYRYQVDLSVDPPETVALAQGTELSELAREERTPNARAGDSGALAMLGG